MQLTITGGTGSVAEYLIKELEGTYDIVVFDRVKPGENRFNYELRHPVVVGDLTDFEACQRAVEGSNAIIHLGGIPQASEHPRVQTRRANAGLPPWPWDETMRVNTMGTFYLLEAARRAGVKTVVAASSDCVLGHKFRFSDRPYPITYLPIDEGHPLDYEDTYSLSKLAKEQILQMYSRAYGMRCYAIRPASVWRIEQQIEYARKYQPPTTWDEGFYAYVDIRDIAKAFRLCMEAADSLPPFDAFFVNAGDTTVLEASHTLVEKFRPDLLDKVDGLVGRQRLISSAKAERSFGYRAQHSWTEHLPR